MKKRRRSLRKQLRSPIAKDLRTPKYKLQVVKNKKKKKARYKDDYRNRDT